MRNSPPESARLNGQRSRFCQTHKASGTHSRHRAAGVKGTSMNSPNDNPFKTSDLTVASLLTCKGLRPTVEKGPPGGAGEVYVFRTSPALQFALNELSSNRSIAVSPQAFRSLHEGKGGTE